MSSHLEKHPGQTALIIYDNFFFAEKANAIFQSAGYQADTARRWNLRSWRLDGLKLSSEADVALTEAADARLIVFAGPRAQSLPVWLEAWLEKWIACCRVAGAAFAVIGGRNGEVLITPKRPELFHFARKHGLSFLVNESFRAESGSQFIASAHFTEEAPKHWGINE